MHSNFLRAIFSYFIINIWSVWGVILIIVTITINFPLDLFSFPFCFNNTPIAHSIICRDCLFRLHNLFDNNSRFAFCLTSCWFFYLNLFSFSTLAFWLFLFLSLCQLESYLFFWLLFWLFYSCLFFPYLLVLLCEFLFRIFSSRWCFFCYIFKLSIIDFLLDWTNFFFAVFFIGTVFIFFFWWFFIVIARIMHWWFIFFFCVHNFFLFLLFCLSTLSFLRGLFDFLFRDQRSLAGLFHWCLLFWFLLYCIFLTWSSSLLLSSLIVLFLGWLLILGGLTAFDIFLFLLEFLLMNLFFLYCFLLLFGLCFGNISCFFKCFLFGLLLFHVNFNITVWATGVIIQWVFSLTLFSILLWENSTLACHSLEIKIIPLLGLRLCFWSIGLVSTQILNGSILCLLI